METKFTKGNWSYKPDKEYPTTHQIWSNYGNKIPTYIAHTCYAIDSESNVKLIASAPDMLEALEYGKKISEKLIFPTEEELKQFVNMATNAIKKATE